jgi:hypothetical protein
MTRGEMDDDEVDSELFMITMVLVLLLPYSHSLNFLHSLTPHFLVSKYILLLYLLF